MFGDYEFWNEIYRNQKNMAESWTKLIKGGEGSDSPASFIFPGFRQYGDIDFFKQQEQMMDMWKEFAEGNYKSFEEFGPQLEKWQEVMKDYNPLEAGKFVSKTAGDVFGKMMNSNAFYLNLYKTWQEVADKAVEPSSQEFKEQFQKMMENYDKIVVDNFVPLLPREVQGLFMNPYNYVKTLTRSVGSFYGPWEDISKEIADIYMEAMLKDPARLPEALDLWKKGYDKTFGALLTSPVVGSSREAIEQSNKMIDALIHFLVVSGEFFTKINNVASEKSREAFEKYFELLEEGAEPKTFNEFYKFWSAKVEKALDQYFYTDEFSKLISFMAESAMEFKMEADKTTETFLENYPVVTKSEVDGVYKNVYDLKKELRSLKSEIEELKMEIRSKNSKEKPLNKEENK